MSSLVEYEANSPLDPDLVPSAPESNTGTVQTDLLAVAWQARWLLMLTVLLGIGVAWIVLQRVEPRYTSVSRIYVERNMPKILSGDFDLSNGSKNFLYTQAELIRSTEVLAAVADDPANKDLDTLRVVENPVGLLRNELEVEVGKLDDIINVYIELPNRNDAAQLVNSIVEAYRFEYAEKRTDETKDILEILLDEKRRRDRELQERIDGLADFRKMHKALAVQVGEENVISKRFAAIAEELDRVELALLDAKARHNRTQDMLEKPSLRPFLLELASSQRSAAQDIRVEEQLQLGIEQQIQEVDREINALRANWGDGHFRVKLALKSKADLTQRLADQKDAIEERKDTIVAAYVERIAQEYQLLEQQREELQRSHDTEYVRAMEVNLLAAKLATLEADVERTTRQVDALDSRISEVELTRNVDVGDMSVSVMDTALPALEPSYPNRLRFLAIGAFLGGLCGFGLAWLRDLLDHRLKSIDEISAALQLPVLGALPISNDRDNRHLTGRIVVEKPHSVAAESFRTLRTAIHFGLTRDEASIITVTSPSPGDGKSTVASNLALVMAQADQRVLLIDADMRKPKQHEIFKFTPERGLSAVLAERQPPEELILETEVSTLSLLPCGSRPANPVELLNNGFFAEFLESLRTKFDKIIIDAPPVMPVADARVIAAQTEATILVLRADRSTRRLSLAARDELWRVRAQRLGVVVNAVPGRKQSNYASGYGYGYGSYGYSSGGYSDIAYGESEPALENRNRKKSRAISSHEPITEPVETVDS